MSEKMKLPTLYELTGSMQVLLDLLEKSEVDVNGEVMPDSALLAELGTTELQFSEKLARCSFILERLNSDAKSLKDWAARFRDAAEAKEKRRKWLSDNVMACLKEVGQVEAHAGPFVLRVAKNPSSVEVIDPRAVPAGYLVVPEPYPDKQKIKQAWKEGTAVEGTRLVTDRTHLRIGPTRREHESE